MNANFFTGARRYIITIAIVLLAVFVGWRLWIHYENDPWTRDGRIKADVIQIAPDVSGLVTKVNVKDNQIVNAGDVLFEIDRSRFDLALRQAKAAEASAKVTLEQAIRESKRNEALSDLVATEVTEQGRAKVDTARAALLQATVARDKAQLDLDRTRVVASVDGIVTNLDLREGSYVNASKAVMALVDRNSYYVEGYFEETKLPSIKAGNKAKIKLMADDRVLEGHVNSISRGIEDRERTTGGRLMQNINPAFNWVRLVQRIPVRVDFDNLPADVKLISGQTVTVEVLPSDDDQKKEEAK
ncbi:MAG: HlyD family secretion protein [Oxalobacter sp.]|jgi:RND family efflux transporter MFP subunit|nr:HlyD family secretion protein [Oxalobacter sp.]